MIDGKIVEQGSYQELLQVEGGALAQLVAEHVSEKQLDHSDRVELEAAEVKIDREKLGDEEDEKKRNDSGALLTMEEDRAVGSVSISVYKRYLQSIGSFWKAPLCKSLIFYFFFYRHLTSDVFPTLVLSCLILAQASSVATTIFLGIWSEYSIAGWKQGQCSYFFQLRNLGIKLTRDVVDMALYASVRSIIVFIPCCSQFHSFFLFLYQSLDSPTHFLLVSAYET